MPYSPIKTTVILNDIELIKVLSWNPEDPRSREFRDSQILQTFILTGIRLNELSQLNRSSIFIRGSDIWLSIHGKGSRLRNVPLPARLFRRFETSIPFLNPKSQALFQPTIFHLSRDPASFRLSNISIYQIVTRRCFEILGYKVNPHLFRHSVASYWIRKGVNIRVVQQLLGHSELSTTARYLHPDSSELIQASQLLAEESRTFTFDLFKNPSMERKS